MEWLMSLPWTEWSHPLPYIWIAIAIWFTVRWMIKSGPDTLRRAIAWCKNAPTRFWHYLQDLPELLAEDMRHITVPRGHLSQTMKNILFLLSIGVIVYVYHYQAYQEENVVLPRWPQMWEGIKHLYWDDWLEKHTLWEDSKHSFMRLIPAVLCAGAVGTVMGLYMGVWDAFEAISNRFLQFIGYIPPIAAMVVFIMEVDFGLKLYITIQVFGILTMSATGVFLATRAVPSEEIHRFKTLGASYTEIVWSLLFKELWPQIIETIRQTIAPATIYLIAAEWETGSHGWGHSFMQFYRAGRMDVIIPYLLFFGFLGIFLKLMFHWFTGKVSPWTRLEVR